MKSQSFLWSLGILSIGAILLLLGGGWMSLPMMGSGMMWGGWMGGGMWIFWICIAAGLYFLFTGTSWFNVDDRKRAQRIAAVRYARGEITADELDEIKVNLERS
jgi:uncharacterized membrane protein